MTKPSLSLVFSPGSTLVYVCYPPSARAGEKVAPLVPLQTTLFPLEDTPLPGRIRHTVGLTPKAPHHPGWDVGHYLGAYAQLARQYLPRPVRLPQPTS
jgi:hypothetical protein